MEVSTVWMHTVYLADNTADFCVDFDHYCNTSTQTTLDTIAALDDEEQRVRDMRDDHNNNQSKRSVKDVVRKGMFENMCEYFKGTESRFAQGAGRRTKHHQEFMHTAASLCQVVFCDAVGPVAEQVGGATRDVKGPAPRARLLRFQLGLEKEIQIGCIGGADGSFEGGAFLENF